MFLMLKNWRMLCEEDYSRQTNGPFQSDELLVKAIGEVSVAIFISSLTDALSFLIGTISDFIAVRKSRESGKDQK